MSWLLTVQKCFIPSFGLTIPSTAFFRTLSLQMKNMDGSRIDIDRKIAGFDL